MLQGNGVLSSKEGDEAAEDIDAAVPDRLGDRGDHGEDATWRVVLGHIGLAQIFEVGAAFATALGGESGGIGGKTWSLLVILRGH